ncbi:MAG: DUF3276 family protein [Porphyromonadaceae bacterium]|nr:DUF3276 family protein [Porphyromonadaceae bacterium]
MKRSKYVSSKELFSKCVKAGSRFYYIDAKQDASGNYYMVMSESRVGSPTGVRERQRIFVYQEDIEKFVLALEEVSAALTELIHKCDSTVDGQEQFLSSGIATLELPDVDQFLGEDK